MFTVNGAPKRVGPGDVLFIQRGEVHGFAVRGDQGASILCVSTPGLFGPAYFREMVEVFEAARTDLPIARRSSR
jgi:quercetin dioxygenase-like cupin family protein